MGFGMGLSLSPAVQPNPPPWSILGLDPYAWLRADIAGSITLVSGKVSNWADQGTHGRDFTQSSAGNRPTVSATYINGGPAVRGNGADQYLSGPTMASVATAGSADVFLVMRIDVDSPPAVPATNTGGCWRFNNGGSEDFFTNAFDANTYCGIFSTARKNCGAKGAHYFETPRLVEVHSAAGAWALLLNGTSSFSTASNTVQGCTSPALLGWPSSTFMNGGIAELLIFAPSLADADRVLVRAELSTRWSLGL